MTLIKTNGQNGGAGNLKTWISIIIVLLSLGFSFGVWANQNSGWEETVGEIKAKVDQMPRPENIAKKDVVQVQMDNVIDKLENIQESIDDLDNKVDRHIQRDSR